MLAARNGAEAADDEIDLRAIWRTLVKHKAMIGGITLLAALAAGIYTLRATPLYQVHGHAADRPGGTEGRWLQQ